MDFIGWLWWAITSVVGVVWSLAWFLLGGWVSTLAQIAVIAGVIFFYKYGWRRAPYEISSRATTFGHFVWNWLRAREPGQTSSSVEVREVIRTVHVKEAGDVNLSTLLSLLMLGGLCLLAAM